MTTRLWFRLDEVLPLAATPPHARPSALPRPRSAPAPRLRPALIWTTTDEGDTLSSTGVPVRYDQDGQGHAAVAWA